MKQLHNTKQKYGFRKVKYVAGLASAVLASVSISTAKPHTVHAGTNTNNLQDNRATGEKAAEEELDRIPDNPSSTVQAPRQNQTSQKRTVHVIDDSTQQDLQQEKPVKHAINQKNNMPNINKSVIHSKKVETPKTVDKDYIPDNPKANPTKTVSHVSNSAVDHKTEQTANINTAALDLEKKQIAAKLDKTTKLYNNVALYNTSLFSVNDADTISKNTVFPNLTKDNWKDPASWGLQKTNVGWTYSIPQYVADSSKSYFMDSNGNKLDGTHSIGLKDQPATYRTHINTEINSNTANASTNSDVLVASMPILINDPMAGMPEHATLAPSFAFKFNMNHAVYDKSNNYIGYLWYNVEKGNDMKIYWHNTSKNYSDNVDINFDFDSVNMDKGWPDIYQFMAKTGKEFDIEFVNPDDTFSNWREIYNPAQDDYPYNDNVNSINARITAPSVYWQRAYFSFDQEQSLDKTDIHKELYHKVEQDYAYDKDGNIVKITSVSGQHFITGSKATDGTQTLWGFRYDLYNIPLNRLADNLTSQQVYDQTPAHSMSYSLQTDGSVLIGYNVSPSDAKYTEDQVRDTVDSLYYTNYQHPEDKQKWINATIDAMKKRNWVAPRVNCVETFLSWDSNRVVAATALDVTPNVKADIQTNIQDANKGDAATAYMQTATLNFIDDDDHDKVISHQLIMGPQDKTKSFWTNVPNDYVLADPSQIIVSHHFVYNDKSVIDIHVKHKIIGNVDNYHENAHNGRDYLIDKIKSHQVKDLIDGLQDNSNKDLDQWSSNISIVHDPDQAYTAKYNDDADISNKLNQINNDYTKQQNDIINQIKDWFNKVKAYNAKRDDFINKLKQEGLWVDGMDPKDFKQNLHIGNEETATVTADVLKNSGTVDDHGSHEGNNGYSFYSSQGADLSGDFLRLTYSNLKDSNYNGEAISKIVVTYHDAKDGYYGVFFKNNPIYGWNPNGNAAARIEFYDDNGNLIHMHSAYLTVGSFNTWSDAVNHEAAILESGGTPLQIPESSVTNHAGNLIYADKDNSSSVLFYYNNPNWNKDPNRVAQDQAYADTHYPQVWSPEIEKRYQGWDSSPSAPNRIFGAIMIKLDEGSTGIDIRPVSYNSDSGEIAGIGNWFNWSTTVPQLSFDAQAPKLELHYHNDNLHLTKTSTYQVIEKMPHPTVDPNKYGNDQVILKTTITAGKDIARDMVTGETKQTKFLGKYTSGTVNKGHTDGVDQTIIWGNDVGLPGYELDPFYAETKEHYDDPNNQSSQGAVLSVSDSNNTIHFDYLVGRNYSDANGVEMSDFPDDQTWYVTMHPLQQHVNIVYVDNDTNETIKTTPLQGLTDEQINLTYEAPANYTIAPNQDLPTNYMFTASDNDDIYVLLNHATKPMAQTHTATRIFKLQFNGQDIKHDYVQTGTITRTDNQDLITGEIDHGDYSHAEWSEVTKDTLAKLYQQYGYQTNGHDFTLDGKKFDTIDDVEIDSDTQDETHIINVVPTQTHRLINYIDIATNNTVASDSVQGVVNAVISYTPNVPYGYELLTPQDSYSIPILGDNTPFDIYVKSSMIHIDHTQPHHKGELIYDDTQPNMVYPNNVDYNDLNQTITRTINVYQPDGVIKQIVQKVVLYRNADYDLSHHETKYTPWQANGPRSWESYTAPDFDGYTPDLSHINEVAPLPDSQDVTINIHYKETGSEVLLAYNDTDESGTEFARYNEGGEPNSTIHINWINHMTQDMPGYEIVPGQVINGQHLDDLLKNHESLIYTLSDVNKPIIINIRHIISDVTNTDPKAKSSSERRLTIIEPNGHTVVYTQHVDFIRTATLDQATGVISYGDWHVSGGYEADTDGAYKAIKANNDSTYTFSSIDIPIFTSYETQSDIIDSKGNNLTDPIMDNSLPSVTVSPDSPARNYLVTYHGNIRMNYYYFVDDDNNEQLVDGIYAFSAKSGHNYHTTITPPHDYELVNPSDADFNYNFVQGQTDVPIAIHIRKSTHQTNINSSKAQNNGIKQIITIHNSDGSTKTLNRIINSSKLGNNVIKNAINLSNYTPEAINKKIGNTIHTDLYYVAKNSIKDVKPIKPYYYVPHFAPTTVKVYTYVPHFAPTVIKAYQSIPTFGTKLLKASTVNPALLGFKQSNIQVQKPQDNLATLGLMTAMLSLLSK